MKNIFTSVVLVALALQTTWFLLPYSWEYMYDWETLQLLSWHGHGAKVDLYGTAPYIFQIAFMVAYIGLAFYKKWARTFITLLIVASVALGFLWGVTVTPALDESVGYVISMADGAILTMAYLTSLSDEFD